MKLRDYGVDEAEIEGYVVNSCQPRCVLKV